MVSTTLCSAAYNKMFNYDFFMPAHLRREASFIAIIR